MATFQTQPAFIHTGPWNDGSRKHPAMKWMEEFTIAFNARSGWDQKTSDWNTPDFSLVKPDGTEVKGAEEAWAEAKALYTPFTSEYHEPFFLVTWETDDGYEMLGQAYLYANCVGQKAEGDPKVKDGQGREWEVKIPGGFRFQYVKKNGAAHGDFEMRRCEIMSDSMPAAQILMKRGVLKLE